MAKKKATKTTKKTKTVKKTPRKRKKSTRRLSEPRTLNEAAQWARKVFNVAKACPEPPCTGLHTANGDEFPYTRAEEIFDTYHGLMQAEGLILVPGDIRTFADGRCYRVECQFHLIDTDTGYSQSMWSCGLGNNGVWSLQSAMTVAKKQCLLTLFQAKWPASFAEIEVGPEEPWLNIWETSTPKQIRSVMEEFFGSINTQIGELRQVLPKRRTRTKKS